MSVRIVKGTVENLLLTVTQVSTGNRVNLTGLPIEFYLTPRTGSGSNTPALTKTQANFALRDQTAAVTKGQADIELSVADTNLLPAGTVVATVFVTEAGDRRRVLYEHVAVE